MMDIGAAFSDPRVFGAWFEGPSWDNWRAVLRGAFGERMTKAEQAFFRSVAKREPPCRRVRELLIISGRRSGKDSVASGIAAHIAASFEPAGKLRPGERAVVALLAVDRSQAQVVLGYLRSYFERIPALAALVESATDSGFRLRNFVDIEIMTSDHRSIRGRTLLCVICDELAYWRSENSASPDREVYRAIRPGLLTLAPRSLLILITTAYRRAGLAFERWSKYFGRDDPKVLVIHAESRQLNPTLPQLEIDEALAEDPQAAAADYLSQWRDDLATYAPRDLIESAVDDGVTVRPPDLRHRYVSFCDASSGQQDSFTCAITHMEGDVAILDCLVEIQAPFNTALATASVAAVLRSYRLHDTMGDDHAKGWVIAEFARHGITFNSRPTEMNRSTIYLETLPLFTAGRVRLLDNSRLVSQYVALERRVLPAGKDRVDHPNRSGHHDDLSNACAGALWRCSQELLPADWSGVSAMFKSATFAGGRFVGGDQTAPLFGGERQMAQLAQMRARRRRY